MPHVTDERLKSYLDTNQQHREQMCLAILSLDGRFSEVRPRHPRGGPDGGRDMDAVYRREHRAYAAVGFLNQADDSSESKKSTRQKFTSDLTRALSSTPVPSVFVFLTNVNLTAGEKNALSKTARKKGITHCEIFDRERLRITLDSADGLSVRFQYLGIPLSEAEQASFFAKWGDDINSVIATGFQRVQDTLDRLLFLQESTNVLSSLQVGLELDRTYEAEEVGHFRAFCTLVLKQSRQDIESLLFGSFDKAHRMSGQSSRDADDRAGISFGIGGGQWIESSAPLSRDDDSPADRRGIDYRLLRSSSSIGIDKCKFIVIRYSNDSLIRMPPIMTVREIDEASFILFLNQSLASKLKSIHVLANEYKLLEIEQDTFRVDDSAFALNLPVSFDATELNDPWVRVRPVMSSTFHFDFAYHTPRRMFALSQVPNTWPIVRGSEPTPKG